MKEPTRRTATMPKPKDLFPPEDPFKKAPIKSELRRLLKKVGPILRGESAIDQETFRMECPTIEDAERYLISYGISPGDEVRIEAIRREAIEFIENYFLKDEGLRIPEEIASSAVSIPTLILMAANTQSSGRALLLQRWACALLRVMHIVYHLTDDIRFKYIHQIQEQVISRFREHIYQDSRGQMFLGKKGKTETIPLEAFDIKRVKERESIILKLLHKRENILAEITDVVGLRLVGRSKMDALWILNYLIQGNLLSYPNSISGQTKNTLIPLDQLEKVLARGEEEQLAVYFRLLEEGVITADRSQDDNPHSLDYRAMNITGREKIELENHDYLALLSLLNKVEEERGKLLSLGEQSEALVSTLASLQEITDSIRASLATMSRSLTFYYPFEVQIMDVETYRHNQKSFHEYKENQRRTAKRRVLGSLIKVADSEVWTALDGREAYLPIPTWPD